MPAQAKAQRGDEHRAAGEMTKFITDRGQWAEGRGQRAEGRGQWKKLGGIKGQTDGQVDNVCSVRFVSKALGSLRSQNNGEVCSRGKIIFSL